MTVTQKITWCCSCGKNLDDGEGFSDTKNGGRFCSEIEARAWWSGFRAACLTFDGVHGRSPNLSDVLQAQESPKMLRQTIEGLQRNRLEDEQTIAQLRDEVGRLHKYIGKQDANLHATREERDRLAARVREFLATRNEVGNRPLRAWCPSCASSCDTVDEDGCCPSCGADVVFEDGPTIAGLRAQVEEERKAKLEAQVAHDHLLHEKGGIHDLRALVASQKQEIEDMNEARNRGVEEIARLKKLAEEHADTIDTASRLTAELLRRTGERDAAKAEAARLRAALRAFPLRRPGEAHNDWVERVLTWIAFDRRKALAPSAEPGADSSPDETMTVANHLVDLAGPVAAKMVTEYSRARLKHGPMHDPHHGYAVLLEEVDELWDSVKMQFGPERDSRIRKEAIQVGAMAIAILVEVVPERPAADSSPDPTMTSEAEKTKPT